MRYHLRKDLRRRTSYFYTERQRFLLKALSMNQTLPAFVRSLARTKLSRYSQDCSATRSVNRCALTGKSRSIYRVTHLNRHIFKWMADAGKLPGIRRSSW